MTVAPHSREHFGGAGGKLTHLQVFKLDEDGHVNDHRFVSVHVDRFPRTRKNARDWKFVQQAALTWRLFLRCGS